VTLAPFARETVFVPATAAGFSSAVEALASPTDASLADVFVSLQPTTVKANATANKEERDLFIYSPVTGEYNKIYLVSTGYH
jgi:hypothetical protein